MRPPALLVMETVGTERLLILRRLPDGISPSTRWIQVSWTYSETARTGDHRWWISDLTSWERDYPDWTLRYDVETILREIYEANAERWHATRSVEPASRS